MPIKINHFDRSKPYYPFIINYICTLHGLIELISRSIFTKIEHLDDMDKDELFEALKLKPEIKEDFKKSKSKTPLIGNLSLKSSYEKSNIDIDIEEIANDLFDNYNYLFPYQIRAACTLLLLAYETTKEYDDKTPIWNFLYHCRNAAAHNGKIEVKARQKLSAKWGNFEITKSLDGTNLFYLPIKGGLLGIGDPIRLLWDIEQQYPQMKAESLI